MSKFLGPVHHRMYSKIQLQEELTSRLLTLFGDPALEEQLNASYGVPDTEPLESIIDMDNIHGWLNSRVEMAEERFAATVEKLTEQHAGMLNQWSDAACALGHEHALPMGITCADAYQMIDGMLLDGMPCDGGRQLLSEDEDQLAFQYKPEFHALCRQGEAGASVFATLREALLGGMLKGSGLALKPLGNCIYHLSKEA